MTWEQVPTILAALVGLSGGILAWAVHRENKRVRLLDAAEKAEQAEMKNRVDMVDVSQKSMAAALARADATIERLEVRVAAAEAREEECRQALAALRNEFDEYRRTRP